MAKSKKSKKQKMKFFLVKSIDGNAVLQAKDLDHALQLAAEYDFDYDIEVEQIEVYFEDETGD